MMKSLSYFTPILLALFVSACDGEPIPETSTEAAITTAIDTENILYALRPVDNNWPANREENTLSKNLLAANYYIVLDGSGSMDGDQCAEGTTKMAIAKTAITQFAEQIPVDANLALYSFDGMGGSERINLATENRVPFFEQIKTIETGGGTPLATAIRYGYQQLAAQAAKQLGYGEYHLVVVTDGIASNGEEPNQILNTVLQQSPVVIHSIGFCLDESHSLNQPGLTAYTAASNADELQRGLQAVLAESTDFVTDSF
jgi:Mg-chelatase subunit ChlD